MKNYLINYIKQQPGQMISYAEYMELVLYHPQYGYYMRQEEKIGRQGDFITTSNISDIFGRTVARWFASLVAEKKLLPHFCELGAGNGRFAKAFLEEWKEHANPPLTYFIVEKSPYHIKRQKELLMGAGPVTYIASLAELAPFCGMIFSNELFDALPVHVIKKQNGEQFEVMVACEGEELIERETELRHEAIAAYVEKYHVELFEGQRIEIALAMENMAEEMALVLEEGMIVTVDYGYTREEWKHPARRDGSLRGYYQHQLIENIFLHPGEMDVTSHIDWDTLQQIGEECGLVTAGKWRQDEFLLHIGILKQLEDHADTNPFSEAGKRNRAIKSLIMPGSMSTSFQVLLQEKQ
ncbi:class I SAM-dependent methyltransferase [Bacillus benzoevorans]|uniref:SAM-dependent MidA family methyltransferase n=1 Tax=Bacillus benzoevorans TaxID=1456 RepID=A0A7X0LUF3_9BACI|nr:SAM-dependent methyltransferase [Bacillus benzoevorans]MBB6444911.1 SAM-dependent MidA family methyltransferase [Bacillus benzoevorans]